MLLTLAQPEQVLQEFETSLRAAPNRFNGLSGAAQAAQQAGDVEKAHTYSARLVSLCGQADGTRRALVEARAFLTQQ